jgi:hypothetical protein
LRTFSGNKILLIINHQNLKTKLSFGFAYPGIALDVSFAQHTKRLKRKVKEQHLFRLKNFYLVAEVGIYIFTPKDFLFLSLHHAVAAGILYPF